MEDQSDKRASQRKNTILYFKVTRQESNEIIGRLADISHKGLMLITAAPLPLLTTIPVLIHVPQTVSHQPMAITIETRWTKRDKNPANNLTGCLITSLNRQSEKILSTLIASYGFRGDEKLIYTGVIGDDQ